MIHATVAVEDGHAVLFSPPTVAPVHTVIGPVVPLAREDEETLWRPNTHVDMCLRGPSGEMGAGLRGGSTWVVVEYDVEEVLVSPGDVVLVFLVQRVQQILPGQASRDHAVLK